ncbi:MAG: hypothetical protein P4M04_01690 [Acidobacteriota bacterium]|nr:hypothetical protein [Acidobacteriota bacterium]
MKPSKLGAVVVGFGAILIAATFAQAQVPPDAPKTCKNEVGSRYQNIPIEHINVGRGSMTANGNYLVNWTATAPGGKRSDGVCVIDSMYNVLRLSTTSGPEPGGSRLTPEDAMRACKNEAANRLRTVPISYIAVQTGSQSLDGSYVVDWQAQPPRAPRQSGSCDVAPNGKVRKLQIDRSSLGQPGPPAAGR